MPAKSDFLNSEGLLSQNGLDNDIIIASNLRDTERDISTVDARILRSNQSSIRMADLLIKTG